MTIAQMLTLVLRLLNVMIITTGRLALKDFNDPVCFKGIVNDKIIQPYKNSNINKINDKSLAFLNNSIHNKPSDTI